MDCSNAAGDAAGASSASSAKRGAYTGAPGCQYAWYGMTENAPTSAAVAPARDAVGANAIHSGLAALGLPVDDQ